jgi:hypothetical protein
MADKFTGFWDAQYGASEDREWILEHGPEEVATTLGPVDVEDLLERLGKRLREVPPGTRVRVDLIAWGGELE